MTIDVTELMTDPDFVSPISIITRVSSVNSRGENTVVEQTTSAVGSVQPASGKTLQRLSDSLRVENVSSFWVKGDVPITGPSVPGVYPTVLVFKTKRYQVLQVFDWTNWGRGYCEGVCVAERPAG